MPFVDTLRADKRVYHPGAVRTWQVTWFLWGCVCVWYFQCAFHGRWWMDNPRPPQVQDLSASLRWHGMYVRFESRTPRGHRLWYLVQV